MDTVQDASGQPFAGWLEGELARYYEPAAVLRRSDRKEILLYRHRESGQHIVYRRIRGRQPVYDSLCLFRSRNIAEVYETTFDGRDTLVIEEYVDGVTIADVLEKRLFTVKEMCGTIIQICEGLHALHERHIIHRDIKPENVMIQHDGVVKLIDFDSSKIFKPSVQRDTTTLGTVGYAAPEQYGEAQSDERTDIYALGILMNVMLTGVHPVKMQARGRAGRLIEKCIMVNPGKRCENVLEIRKALKKIVD